MFLAGQVRRFAFEVTLFLCALWTPSLGAEDPRIPSVFNHSFVNATGRLSPKVDQLVDFNVITIFPVLYFGPSLRQAYRRLGVRRSEEAWLDEKSMEYRKKAFETVLYNLEQQGFPYESIPEGMKAEYDELLQNSAIVIVAGPKMDALSPIYGVASISYDWGNGTAGERRLGIRVPRPKPETKFIDFHVHEASGPIAVIEDYSLLLSSRLWSTGGELNVMELKTLELTQDKSALQAQAERLGVSVREVKAQIFAILQHAISSFLLTGKEVLPASQKTPVPSKKLLEKRIRKFQPLIKHIAEGNSVRKHALEEAMRQFALDPVPQEFSLVDTMFAYVGGYNPKKKKDLIKAKEQLFRTRFPFRKKLFTFPDPEVPEMTLSVLQGTRNDIDRGDFLKTHSSQPGKELPFEPHIYRPFGADMTFVTRGLGGVVPPNISGTFRCDEFLREFKDTY